MAWVDLANNQMISFTDAQTSGFTLQSGQSSVTSNQCMTKDDALTKYVLDSSYMSSYASNQLVPKEAWVSGGITYTQLFDLYDDPCGSPVIIYLGSDGIYYANTSGSLYNGTVYQYYGVAEDLSAYVWAEYIIEDGIFISDAPVISPCSPS